MASTWEWKPYTKTIHRSGYAAIDPTNPANTAAGKVVLVTGGGAGIGKSIAEAFVKAGAKAVVLLGRRGDVLKEAQKQLSAGEVSTKILTFGADVADESALKSAFESAAKEVGPIDIVVANAAYLAKPDAAATADLADWWKGYGESSPDTRDWNSADKIRQKSTSEAPFPPSVRGCPTSPPTRPRSSR